MSDRMQITRQLHVCRQASLLRLAAVISADCVARTAQGENRQTPGTNEVILLVVWRHILDPIESCVRDDSCADPIRDARNHPSSPRIPRMITALQRCRNREQPVVTTRRAPIVILRCTVRRYAVIAPIGNTLRTGKWTPRRQADRGLATATHSRKLQKCGARHRLFDPDCQGTVVCCSLFCIRR
jgi:hypothetical protein